MAWWLLGGLSVVLAIFVAYLEWKFISWRKTPWYVIFLVWIGWFFSFSVVLLLPIDIASSNHADCVKVNGEERCVEPWIQVSHEALQIVWAVLYWTTFVLCWTAYPILQSYSTAGDFTFFEKLRSALKENFIFYTVCGVVMGLLIVVITVRKHLNGSGLYGVAIAASNAWGLFLLICLLGYGLVEIPKRLWRKANRELTLKYFQFEVVAVREAYLKSRDELDTTLKLVKKYSECTKDDAFRPFVDKIVSKCPPQYNDLVYGEGDFDLKYDKLVKLHKRVISSEHEAVRSKCIYDKLLSETFALEDILRARGSPERAVNWSFQPRRNHRFAAQADLIEWVWKVYLEPTAMRIGTVFLALLSISVIWSEVVFSLPVDLSIFAQLMKIPNLGFTLQWLFTFLPVLYISFCAYWSLFKLRLFNYYRLIPHHQSDANSILFSAAYLCRLVAPLAYNFLLMIRSTNTSFTQVFKSIKVAPVLGDQYNIYFPIILIVFVISNIFNLYTRCVTTFCFKRFVNRFVFDEDFSDSRIEEGKEILLNARQLKQRGQDEFSLNKKPTSRLLDNSIKGKSSPPPNSRFPSFQKMFGKKDSGRESLLERGQLGESP